jgi:hypothetical protein
VRAAGTRQQAVQTCRGTGNALQRKARRISPSYRQRATARVYFRERHVGPGRRTDRRASPGAASAHDRGAHSTGAAHRPTLRGLTLALLQENKASQATGEIRDRLEALAKSGAIPQAVDAPLLSTGVHEFKSSRDPSQVYRVTFGRAGHLECTCEGFRWRGNCKHVREVRAAS